VNWSFLVEYGVTFAWFILVLLAAEYAGNVWSGVLGRAYWIMMAPGVAIHELSHAAGCLIMFAKINKIRLFGPKGGEVQHGKPKIPVIGPVVISLAPMVGCVLALTLVGMLLKSPLYKAIQNNLAPMNLVFSPRGVGDFVTYTIRTIWELAKGIRETNWLEWRAWLFIYAAVCLGICMRPSGKDLKNCIVGLIGVGVTVAALDAVCRAVAKPIPEAATGMVTGSVITRYVLEPMQEPLHYLIAFLGLVLFLTFVAWVIRLIIHEITAPVRGRGKSEATEAD